MYLEPCARPIKTARNHDSRQINLSRESLGRLRAEEWRRCPAIIIDSGLALPVHAVPAEAVDGVGEEVHGCMVASGRLMARASGRSSTLCPLVDQRQPRIERAHFFQDEIRG